MLIGFPIKEYELIKNNEPIWISKDILDVFIKDGGVITGETRMSYAKPSWVPKTENPNGGILILDDFNRADLRFLQAVMELIDRSEFLSWSLPENWTIILTSNPDNGDYNVNSIDNAVKTRYISFEMEHDVNSWAKWAEEEQIDERAINFLLSYPEVLNKEGGVQTVNPRSLVTFFNTISGFKDFSDINTLEKILNISEGCFTSKDNVVGNLFTLFINNKLDKLPKIEDLISKKWDTLKPELTTLLYNGDIYRADIASVLTTRFLNYADVLFSKKGSKSDPIINRLLEIVDDNESNDKILFSEDLIFNMIKKLINNHGTRMKKLTSNPKIIKKIV